MQFISEKDLSKKKKPVQVYFESEILMLIQAKLVRSKDKMSMAEYIRILVEEDLGVEKTKIKKRKWKSVPLGLDLCGDSRAMDEIIYKV